MINKLTIMNRHLRITLLFGGFVFFILLAPFVGMFWFLSLILSVALLVLLIYTNGEYDKKHLQIMESSLDNALSQLDFQVDDYYLSDDYLTGVAISIHQNKLLLLKRDSLNSKFKLNIIYFDDIIECSIKEDDVTLTKTSKGLAVGGALLTGSVGGAIVGGLLSDKKSTEQIVKSTLSIVVDDIDNPNHEINFLNSKMLVSKNSEIYQNIFIEMNKWHKRISVIIKRQLNTKVN